MAEWIALVVSVVALVFASVTFWRTEIKPYTFIIPPPVVTQVNDGLASLILDLAFQNDGGIFTLVTDIRIRCLSKGKVLPVVLHAQKTLERMSKLSSLSLSNETTVASVFLPFAINRAETAEKRIYLAPYESELPILEAHIIEVDTLVFDVFLDGTWKNLYAMPYTDFQSKFKGQGIIEIPEEGFAPRWYPEQTPIKVTGPRRVLR